MENCSLVLDNCTDLQPNVTAPDAVLRLSCGDWQPAQHNIFQISNLFFAAAFLVPRSYKQGIIFLRALLCCGFFVQALWSGVNVCSGDAVLWGVVLGLVNLGQVCALIASMVPPSLTPELTDLYLRLFHPLKVSRKHFKELVKEGSIHILDPNQPYAIEDVTNADERLSILLKGKLKVTCDSIHLHYISAFQFIDSPEWEAGHITSDELFQVTITAEEDSMYFSWPKLKLDRVLRHRPMLKVVLSNLIGKDITQKLYWLNEAMGISGGLPTSKDGGMTRDQWQRLMPRSQSVDAVNTTTKGTVRSLVWTTHNLEPHLSDDQTDHMGKSWSPHLSTNERSPLVTPSVGSPRPIHTPFRSASVRRHREVTFEESNV